MSAAVAHQAPYPRRAAAGCCFRRSARAPAALPRSALPRCSAAPEQQPAAQATGRRALLLGTGLLLAGGAACPPSGRAEEAGDGRAAPSSSEGLVTFSSPSQGYTLLRPASWEQVDKAGADALFRDPAQKSSNVGVTVYPVTIERLEQFGDLDAVGERLLAAERAKESTLGVTMVAQTARALPSGPAVYDFEYELESTRGRKRILSTVTIARRKLYIANGNVGCSKESCDAAAAAGALPLVRRVTQSLAIQ
ncbi:psbP domain-containing chloroplastic [Chlorella sorokiniana]|uniref:PsbP domain-containing chloroplastic n=1 Tax=Chlorella sorokiniana TaxID=3076 RepID=A0A2P6TL23_CHLSO|nr:psbP domain-containing chloroplastic [Chlorella sorokiniana]|eukprot:PRW44979.1 psbP domain-containing chloroplastic [Chlorella sorokiniana]